MQTALPRPEEAREEPLQPGVLAGLMVGGHAVKHIYNSGFFLILPEIARALSLSNTSVGFLNTRAALPAAAATCPRASSPIDSAIAGASFLAPR